MTAKSIKKKSSNFHKVIVECTDVDNEESMANEFYEIYSNEVRTKLQLSTSLSLYHAVHGCRDMVHVTDDRHFVQVRYF